MEDKDQLTGRELKVLGLIVEGKTREGVAHALHISPRTVARHLSNIYRKLGVENRIQAFRKALSLGLFTVDKEVK